MLVEDDNNLREIYGARLQAEGHEIVAAKDGEEALAIAVKEKPDLIISDVMMPRVSGFDMLDILRNAPETRDTKVIMMTALSQAEDKARADKLGADRYLVKSQVTLEDVANVVREVLTGDSAAATPTAEAQTSETPGTAPEAPAVTPEVPSATEAPSTETPSATPTPPTVQDVPVATPPADDAATSTPAEPTASPASEPAAPATSLSSDDSTPAPSEPAEEKPAETPTIPSPNAAPTPIAPPPNAITPETPANEPAKEPTKINIVEAPTTDDATPANETSAEAPSAPTVVLPTPPDEVSETPKPEDKPAEAPASAEPAAPVGPNLAEALAEEEHSTSSTETATTTPATPDVPEVANGTENQVITPTKEPEAPKEEEPDVVAGPPDRTSTDPLDDDRIKKKIIEPINDITKGPDLQALLAAEEKKAPVETPGASSVITPSDASAVATAPTPETPEAPKATPNDEHSKIAL